MGKLSKAFKYVIGFTKDLFQKFQKDDPISHSASIAFYTIFSLPAILIIVMTIAGSLFGAEAVRGEIVGQFEDYIGLASAKAIENIIVNAAISDRSTPALIIGIATLLFGATTVFASIQTALNHIFRVRTREEKAGLLRVAINRLLSFAMVVILGFLMLVSLLMDIALAFLRGQLKIFFPDTAVYLGSALNLVVSIFVVTVIFALIFLVLPDVRLRWSQVWRGSVFTSVLFFIGKYLIGFYLGTSDITTTYGAAGALVLILIWVYYSSAILLLGAEYIYVFLHRRGRHVKPVRDAEIYIEKPVEIGTVEEKK